MTRRAPLEPRKTLSQRRSTSTIGFIVEAAARILEERGTAGYTTNAVAERAGVSVGSLYQYFPNKDALTVALIGRETSVLMEGFEAAARVGADGLATLIDAAVTHQLQRPVLARLLDVEEARLPIAEQTAKVAAAGEAALAQMLGGDAVAAPWIVGDVMAMVKGIVDAAGQRGEQDVFALAARVRHAVFGYLAAERDENAGLGTGVSTRDAGRR